MIECDVAIIGAGTAGLAAERAARKGGASTLLIDPLFDGTTCATVGCMPSKLLIAAAKAVRGIHRAELFGITASDVRIDGAAVFRRVRSERDRFAALTRKSFEDLPQGIAIKARARFQDTGHLALDDGRVVKARTIIIATGSAPAIPPAFAGLRNMILTNETVFDLEEVPKRLAVIGSGSIGLELAQAFAGLGTSVSLFDRGVRLGKIRCPRVQASLLKIIRRDMDIYLETDVTPEPISDGMKLRWSGSEPGEAIFDKVLVAVGRPPQLSGLGLERTGIALDDRGVPVHDRATMRCGDSSIFLAGDAAADLPLLHEASHDGAIAGRNAAAWPKRIRTKRHVPFSITFTDPVTVSIGRSEAEGAVTGTADFSDQGRSRVEGVNEGALTLYASAPDGKLIGADLTAPAGEHLGHMIAWAIEQGLTATQMLEMPFYHPTVEEGLKEALRTICAATPLPLPDDQDSGVPSGS